MESGYDVDADLDRLASLTDDAEAPALIAHIFMQYPGIANQFELARHIAARKDAHVRLDHPVRTVAQFCFGLDNGGIERVTASLAGIFQKAGYESLVIVERELTDECYPLAPGVAVERVPPLVAAEMEPTMAAHLEGVRRALRAHDADVYVYQPWVFPFILPEVMLAHALGIPFVLATHGIFSWALTQPGELRYDFALVCGMARLADAVVSPNETNRDFYAHLNANSLFIPNPVPDDVANDREQGAPASGHGTTILWTGRMSAEKRCDEVLRIFATVHDDVPGAHLVMLGTGDQGYLAGLHSLEHELGVEGAVEWPGYVADVMPWYHKADALLLTSPSEGFCMTLLEASAAGLPVVMYDLPYLPFASSEGVVSVPQGDVRAAARELGGILGDEGRRMRMRDGALACFDGFRDYGYAGAWKDLFGSLEEEHPLVSADDALTWDILLEDFVAGELSRDATATEVAEGAREEGASEKVAEFEASRSWKVGRAVTAPIRKLKG